MLYLGCYGQHWTFSDPWNWELRQQTRSTPAFRKIQCKQLTCVWPVYALSAVSCRRIVADIVISGCRYAKPASWFCTKYLHTVFLIVRMMSVVNRNALRPQQSSIAKNRELLSKPVQWQRMHQDEYVANILERSNFSKKEDLLETV